MLGEGVPRESSINHKRQFAPTQAREQRTRGEAGWFPAPRSMNQVRTKSARQDAWQQPSHSARGRTGAKCLGESHRPGGDLGDWELGTLSGDYVA